MAAGAIAKISGSSSSIPKTLIDSICKELVCYRGLGRRSTESCSQRAGEELLGYKAQCITSESSIKRQMGDKKRSMPPFPGITIRIKMG
jgi:hypothetical protein